MSWPTPVCGSAPSAEKHAISNVPSVLGVRPCNLAVACRSTAQGATQQVTASSNTVLEVQLRIGGAKTPQDVALAVRAQLDSLPPQLIAAAVCKISELTRNRSADDPASSTPNDTMEYTLNGLFTASLQSVAHFGIKDMSALLHGLSGLRYSNQHLGTLLSGLAGTALSLPKRHFEDCSPQV